MDGQSTEVYSTEYLCISYTFSMLKVWGSTALEDLSLKEADALFIASALPPKDPHLNAEQLNSVTRYSFASYRIVDSRP